MLTLRIRTLLAAALAALCINAQAAGIDMSWEKTPWGRCVLEFEGKANAMGMCGSGGCTIDGKTVEDYCKGKPLSAEVVKKQKKQALKDIATSCGRFSGDLDTAIRMEEQEGGKLFLPGEVSLVPRKDAEAACKAGWEKELAAKKKEQAAKDTLEIRIGSPEENIRKKFGAPLSLTTTTTAQGTSKVYVYRGMAVHTTNGRVTAIVTHQ